MGVTRGFQCARAQGVARPPLPHRRGGGIRAVRGGSHPLPSPVPGDPREPLPPAAGPGEGLEAGDALDIGPARPGDVVDEQTARASVAREAVAGEAGAEAGAGAGGPGREGAPWARALPAVAWEGCYVPVPRGPVPVAGDVVVAGLVALAARAGRVRSEADRTGLGYWNRRQQWLESAAGELHQARLEYEVAEARRRKEREAEMRRAAEAAREAGREREAARREALEARRRAEEALEEQRREFERREREAEAEFARREAEGRERVRERVRERRERERRAVEERREGQARARAEREREEREAEEREEREAEERRLRIREASDRVTMPLSGSVRVWRSPPGTLVDPTGLSADPAAFSATVACGSLSGGSFEETAHFRDEDDALRGGLALCFAVGARAVEGWKGAALVKRLAGAGPLAALDELEAEAFARAAKVRCEAALGRALAAQLEALRGAGGRRARAGAGAAGAAAAPAAARVSAPTTWLAARDEADAAPARLRAARLLVQEGRGDAAARTALRPLVADLREQLGEGLGEGAGGGGPAGAGDPRLAAAPLVLAAWLARVLEERPRGEAGASPWFEQSLTVARRVLADEAAAAGEDVLTPVSDTVARVLGDRHPVAAELERLARGRMSPAERARREAARAAEEERRVARMVEEEWPEYAERARMRAEESEALTPLPEKAWALRNVALASGNPERARAMLRQGLGYLERHLGSDAHPGLLTDMLALAGVCEGRAGEDPAWAAEAAALRRRAAGVVAAAAAAAEAGGDPARAAALLLGAAAELAGPPGGDDAGLAEARLRGEALLASLPGAERDAVARAVAAGGVVRGLAEESEVRLEARRDLEKELEERHRRAPGARGLPPA